MFNFHSTASLIFGNETAVNSSDQIVNLLGKNIFVITDEGLTELGLYDKTIKKLQSNSNINIFDKVESDPSKSTLLKAFNEAADFKSTGVLGFGGGSSMDVAKLISLLLGSNQNIDTIWGVNNAKGPRIPLVLIPTTAGTGSEVTPISIITMDNTLLNNDTVIAHKLCGAGNGGFFLTFSKKDTLKIPYTCVKINVEPSGATGKIL